MVFLGFGFSKNIRPDTDGFSGPQRWNRQSERGWGGLARDQFWFAGNFEGVLDWKMSIIWKLCSTSYILHLLHNGCFLISFSLTWKQETTVYKIIIRPFWSFLIWSFTFPLWIDGSVLSPNTRHLLALGGSGIWVLESRALISVLSIKLGMISSGSWGAQREKRNFTYREEEWDLNSRRHSLCSLGDAS